MNRAQRADALLACAAKWQVCDVSPDSCWEVAKGIRYPFEDATSRISDWPEPLASAALSEAAALGFDLVQADGSED